MYILHMNYFKLELVDLKDAPNFLFGDNEFGFDKFFPKRFFEVFTNVELLRLFDLKFGLMPSALKSVILLFDKLSIILLICE